VIENYNIFQYTGKLMIIIVSNQFDILHETIVLCYSPLNYLQGCIKKGISFVILDRYPVFLTSME
jgi:hypothetical protein